jgi:hypothetical protein
MRPDPVWVNADENPPTGPDRALHCALAVHHWETFMHWAFVDYENVGSLEDISLEQYERIYVFCGPKNSKLKLGELPAEGFCRIELIGLKTSGRNNLDFHLTFYLGRHHEVAEKQVGFHVISNDIGFEGVVEHLRKLGREAQRIGTRPPRAKTNPRTEGRAARLPRQTEAAPAAAGIAGSPEAPVTADSTARPRRAKAAVKTKSTPKKPAVRPAAPKTELAPVNAGLSPAALLLLTQLKQTGDTQRPSKKAKLLNWMQNRLQGPHVGVAPDSALQELIAAGQLSLSGANVTYRL